jgi:ABC-type antimicrobial peptide transport system permease subunit
MSQQRAYSNFAVLLVRTRTNPLDLLPSVRREVATLEPEATISAVRTMEKDLLTALSTARMATTLTTAFGCAALVLAVIGLYGVTAYAVARRTREIGIRLALGSQKRNVLKLVLGEGFGLIVIGEAIGLFAAYASTRLIASQLHGIEAHDPLTFVVIALLLAMVSIAATFIPARRATRVDPIIALREQ